MLNKQTYPEHLRKKKQSSGSSHVAPEGKVCETLYLYYSMSFMVTKQHCIQTPLYIGGYSTLQTDCQKKTYFNDKT